MVTKFEMPATDTFQRKWSTHELHIQGRCAKVKVQMRQKSMPMHNYPYIFTKFEKAAIYFQRNGLHKDNNRTSAFKVTEPRSKEAKKYAHAQLSP